MTATDRGRCHTITAAGPIEPHEIETARRKADGKRRPVSYFLSVVESERAEYWEQRSGKSSPPRPAKSIRHVEPLGPDGLPLSAERGNDD
jgi:hypothetical protein